MVLSLIVLNILTLFNLVLLVFLPHTHPIHLGVRCILGFLSPMIAGWRTKLNNHLSAFRDAEMIQCSTL